MTHDLTYQPTPSFGMCRSRRNGADLTRFNVVIRSMIPDQAPMVGDHGVCCDPPVVNGRVDYWGLHDEPGGAA